MRGKIVIDVVTSQEGNVVKLLLGSEVLAHSTRRTQWMNGAEGLYWDSPGDLPCALLSDALRFSLQMVFVRDKIARAAESMIAGATEEERRGHELKQALDRLNEKLDRLEAKLDGASRQDEALET